MARACIIVLDAVGAGALPDAADYGDEGSDTLGNVARGGGGLVLGRAFPTYPHGFPFAIIEEFAHRTGRGVLGNVPASGTEIIQELGEEHQRSGKWMGYK